MSNRTYLQLDAELQTIGNFLKGIYDFEPQSTKYTQWREEEINHWTAEYTRVKNLIGKKLDVIPFEIIWNCIQQTDIKIEMPDNF